MTTNSDPQGAADQRAHDEWMDGEGADCATTTGFWHAALAWERKRATPPTPARAEELAAASEFWVRLPDFPFDRMRDVVERDAAIIARHFQPLREQHASQERSITTLLTKQEQLREELARVKETIADLDAISEKQYSTAVEFQSQGDALRTENAALREKVNKAFQELKPVHAYVQSVKNHIPIEIVARVLNAESILSK